MNGPHHLDDGPPLPLQPGERESICEVVVVLGTLAVIAFSAITVAVLIVKRIFF